MGTAEAGRHRADVEPDPEEWAWLKFRDRVPVPYGLDAVTLTDAALYRRLEMRMGLVPQGQGDGG